jgi:hypothetical protein
VKTYIGIDCGKDGAMVFLNENGIFEKMIMPTVKVGVGRDFDIEQIDYLIGQHQGAFIGIEDPGGHAPSAAGLRSMTASYNIVKTIVTLRKLPYVSLLSRKWQGAFWNRPQMPKGQKFDTKAAALAAAKRIFPSESWVKSARASVDHDGLVDAALIAEYCRRSNY